MSTGRSLQYLAFIGLAACAAGRGDDASPPSGAASSVGQFGNAPATAGSIHAPAKVVELAAASDHVCARLVDDRVYCWGDLVDNVCDGTAGQAYPRPRLIDSLSYRGITKLALASPHCALLASGHVLCWGTYIPQVLGLGVADLSSADNCSWKSCEPPNGQIVSAPCTPPTLVPLDTVRDVSTGKDHVCARKSDGSVWCWGWNTILQAFPDVQWTAGFMAQNAGNEPDYIGPPRQIPTIAGAMDIVSSTGSCARMLDGSVTCWGGDEPPGPPGVLEGNGIHLSDYTQPVRPVPLKNVVQLTLGDYVAFALLGDGSVMEFGFGPGNTPIQPFAIPEIQGAVSIFATPWDDTVVSSGVRFGQYLAAVMPDRTVRVVNVAVPEVVHDQNGAAAVAADGGYVTEQEEFLSAIPVGTLKGAANVRLVAAAEEVLCVVIGDDEVLCLGDNTFGQLGNDTVAVGGRSQTFSPVIWPPEPGPTQ